MQHVYRRSLICFIAAMCYLCCAALTPESDLEATIKSLNAELKSSQTNIDKELECMQNARVEYWNHIRQLQKEIDKAVLVLYSQDGGSLFSVGMASEGLHDVCQAFRSEKAPFEKWLQAMSVASSKHQHIRSALQKVHQENLTPEYKKYVRQSIAICDSLDRRFASLRDSIALDRSRYQKMAKEIEEIEHTNQTVVDNLRDGIFNDNDEDFITFYTSFDYLRQDVYYENEGKTSLVESNSTAERDIDQWGSVTTLIAFILWVVGSIAMRIFLPKKSLYRSRRRYYMFLVALGFVIVSGWVMSMFLDYNAYLGRVEEVYSDFYIFLFLLLLSAVLRLPTPGLGWSVLSYLPFIGCAWSVMMLAITLTRTSTLQMLLPLVLILWSVIVLVILAVGIKKIKKADYLTSFSCMGIVLLATVLSVTGYHYLSTIVVLYSMSVISYFSGFVCFKRLLHKRLQRAGKFVKLTLNYLVYPYFYVIAIVGSLYSVAYIFNLSTWLSHQLSTPFISMPQFGFISVSRLLNLLCLAVLVNYVVKLVKLILSTIDSTKYTTGNAAVAVTLGTMLVWFGYLLTALYVLRINHSGIVAAIGGASLGLGFAMKDTFENFFCGLSLMASRARPGDIVECDGARGIIKKIGIISTQIQIEDGPIVSFPNRQILGRNFTNLTLNNRREIRHIVFDISDRSDLEKAKALMLEAAKGIDGVVDHDQHYVVMKNTSCGIVRLDYKCWIDSSCYLRTEPAVREAIFKAFKANGIEIAKLPNEIDMRATTMILGGR